MINHPDPKKLVECLDGIGAEIADATEHPKTVDKRIALRQYTVRYIIPTVSSSAYGKSADCNMRVAGNSAEDAVKAVLAAYPSACITSVE